MHRRDFIKIISATGAVTMLPSALSGCATTKLTALEDWQPENKTHSDIRLRILSYAILAPNAHNKQPWLVKLKNPMEFELYIDQMRLLPETDPPARQIHISHGTFIELLELAAKNNGYLVDIHYFPKGMSNNTTLNDKPIAAFKLIKSKAAKPDILFDSILQRVSNKREYDEQAVTSDTLTQLSLALHEDVSLFSFTNDPRLLKTIGSITTRAMEIETQNPARDDETLKMFRFNDEEINYYRDGLSMDQSGMSGMMKVIAETFFVTREKVMNDKQAFAKEAMKLTKKQADSAAVWAWLTTENNTRKDQVLIGRTFSRIQLKATQLGLALQPMSQALQEYADMSDLQKELIELLKVPQGHTVQMLFRLGYAPTVRHTARRKLKHIVIG